MATALIAGQASGPVLALAEPLSFWGGVREADGTIIDVHHPQHGASVSGHVLVMPGARGSSSSSSVLAELVRRGVHPAALILREPDPILAVGAHVAELLYGVTVPVLTAGADEYAVVARAARCEISPEGDVRCTPSHND